MKSIILLASLMCGETFTVTNRMPAFHVRNLMPPTITKAPCHLCDNCQCTACNCPDLTKKPAFVPKTKLTAFSTPVAKQQTVVVHQSSSAHTHACPNPACSFRRTYGEPYVWNHSMDGGSHVCAYCKTVQKYVSGRPVTIIRSVATDATLRPSTAAYAAPQTTSFYSLPRASANCANGNCATITFR